MDLMSTAQLLGNFGEFFGAMAVVVTLGYLAVQIRQSNLASQSTAIQSFFDSFSSVNQRSHDEAFVHLLCSGVFQTTRPVLRITPTPECS